MSKFGKMRIFQGFLCECDEPGCENFQQIEMENPEESDRDRAGEIARGKYGWSYFLNGFCFCPKHLVKKEEFYERR